MQKNFWKKIICTSTALSFVGATIKPYVAHANNLVPLSFSRMYSLAQNGDVEALRASVRRGMNINVMDENGDTGLCIAAKKHDSYTYNSFRAAGANPRHPCTQYIDDYEDFVNSSKTVSVTANTREAYSAIGKEKYSISPYFWWIAGGTLVAGGATALALSGGGGGGGKGNNSEHAEEYNSLGSLAVSKTEAKKTTSSTANNKTSLSVTNNNSQISSIDLSSNILKNTEYMKSGVLARKGGAFTNNSDGIITLGSGTIGMIAVDEGSEVINSGYINADANNAAVAMVASEKSSAINNAKGILSSNGSSLGIDLSFSGTDEKDNYSLIGMYADTNSIATNNGDINGSATKSTSQENQENITSSASTQSTTATISGKIIGMEAMILNAGNEVKGKEIKITNSQNGKISISAGDGGTETSIKLTAYGMGSFLDDAFLNGSKNINRAEIVSIENFGIINLGYTGVYTVPSDTSLRKGTGGVVGIRADANTTATNTANGSINLTFTEYSSSETEKTSSSISVFADDEKTEGKNIGAGMQSVHGADLTNNGNINIKTTSGNSIKNYGMISVEGAGTVSGLYTDMKQVLNNNNTITIEASNSYGMASFNGGTLNNNNSGHIIIGSAAVSSDTLYTNNIALYGSGDGTIVTLNNSGTIDVYSYNSVAIKNDYAGGQTLTNNGTITIHKSATGSSVFGGFYSVAMNNGIINYETTSIKSEEKNDESSETQTIFDPFSNYSLDVLASVITNKSSATTSSTTEEIYNNQESYININGSSYTSAMSVETAQGVAENKGTINLNPYQYNTEENSVGMYLNADTSNFATLINSGNITTESYKSAAMASASSKNAAMINNGDITTKKAFSLGMYALDRTVITNNGNINITKSDSTAIYNSAKNSSITNNGTIEIQKVSISDENLDNVYGIFSKGSQNNIRNTGSINIGLYKSTDTGTSVNNSIGIALSNTSDTGTKVENAETGKIQLEKGTGIKSVASNVTINNYGTISVRDGNGIELVDGSNGTIANYGTINTPNGYGIYVDGTNAKGAISIKNYGTINANKYGVYAIIKAESEESKFSIINEGTINLSDADGYGIYIETLSSSAYLNVDSNGSIDDFRNYQRPKEPDAKFEENIHVVGNPQPQPTYASCEEGATCAKRSVVNNGTISAQTLNFSNPTIQYILGAKGSYIANTLQGSVAVDPTVVVGSHETSYTINNAFIGQDEGVELLDSLYMFNSSLQTNELGNLNAVLTMNDMHDIVQNTSLADYLSYNYEHGRAESFFDKLKTSESASQFNQIIKQKFGTGFIPNLAKQNLDIERTVNQEVNADLMMKTNAQNRHNINVLTYKNKVAAKGNTDGYEDKVVAAYGFSDLQKSSNMRVGYGLNALRLDSKYDDGSSRYSNMLEAFLPVSITYNNTTALIKPKAGFSRGRYRRPEGNLKHKADTKNYYFGADILFKQDYMAYGVEFEPMAGFNLTDLYMEDVDENNNGLHIGSKNVLSAQSQVGLDIKKRYELNSDNHLELSAGGKYYHEFGHKYRPAISLKDTEGVFVCNDNRTQRDFGLLTLKAKYLYRNFTVQTTANVPLEEKHKPYYMLNFGYNF